jgi:inner membrane protein
LELFAHPGITLGAATVIADAVNRKPSWFTNLAKYLDIRWLLVGSLLPDIIDKPVGIYLFRDTFSNGRIFFHSLLFLAVLFAIGIFLWKRYQQKWMLALAAGDFAHLVLDSMWLEPETLFWPFMGVSFPRDVIGNWWLFLRDQLTTNTVYFVSEIVGFLVLLVFLWLLIKRKSVLAFIKHGRVAK